MAARFAVRATKDAYEVYDVPSGDTMQKFPMGRTEAARAKALGLANATREDMNRDEYHCNRLFQAEAIWR